MDQKQKKIHQLRTLLSKAKTKIQQLISSLTTKDKQLTDLKSTYDKKIHTLQTQSTQIINQYQARLLRLQQSLEDSDHLVKKYQAQALTSTTSNQQNTQILAQIGNLTIRIFTLNKSKDNSQAVQQLCSIQKCKQYIQQLQKIQKNQDLTPIFKTLIKLTDLLSQTLSKKRESRLIYIKKQAQLKKSLQQQQDKLIITTRKIYQLQTLYQKLQFQSKNQIQQHHQFANKKFNQQTNLEFVKQLMLKIFQGPKQASIMALQVLTKVLNMNTEQVKICSKNIK